MKIAIVAAGFTPDEADQLRRAMATFRKNGTIHQFESKMIEGMVERGYERDFAERCFRQIEGFGEYGFPESHAASFALLAYISAWFKCHYPAVFACALLNSQPMGFYAPAQIVRDAIEHGVEVREVDVNFSDWDCTLELADPARTVEPIYPLTPTLSPLRGAREQEGPSTAQREREGERPGLRNQGYALRLGLRQIKGLGKEDAERLVARRGNGYADSIALSRRAALSSRVLAVLARADACRSLGLDRRQALWALRGQGAMPLPLFAAAAEEEQGAEAPLSLPVMGLGEHVAEDYSPLH